MTTTTTGTAVHATLAAWTEAEIAGTPAGIDDLLTGDFTGIGPLGFVLTRAEWLDRHASGDLRYEALRLDDVDLAVHDGHARVIARQTGTASYRNHPVPSVLRVTVLLRRDPDRWRVAHVHSSFVAGTPGAPAIPGRG